MISHLLPPPLSPLIYFLSLVAFPILDIVSICDNMKHGPFHLMSFICIILSSFIQVVACSILNFFLWLNNSSPYGYSILIVHFVLLSQDSMNWIIGNELTFLASSSRSGEVQDWSIWGGSSLHCHMAENRWARGVENSALYMDPVYRLAHSFL